MTKTKVLAGDYECLSCGYTIHDPVNRICPECSGKLFKMITVQEALRQKIGENAVLKETNRVLKNALKNIETLNNAMLSIRSSGDPAYKPLPVTIEGVITFSSSCPLQEELHRISPEELYRFTCRLQYLPQQQGEWAVIEKAGRIYGINPNSPEVMSIEYQKPE